MTVWYTGVSYFILKYAIRKSYAQKDFFYKYKYVDNTTS